MAELRHVVLCELTDPFGAVTPNTPLVVSVDEAGWCRLELSDGSVWRCPWGELAAAGEPGAEERAA